MPNEQELKDAAAIKAEREALLLEKEKLELVKLRQDVATIQEEKQRKIDDSTRQFRDAEANRKRDEAVLKSCNHMKGGRDQASLRKQGDDGGNYSVMKDIDGFGHKSVICTRCTAFWKEGDTAESHPTGISFQQAWNFPTDNISGTCIQFGIPYDQLVQQQKQLALQQTK